MFRRLIVIATLVIALGAFEGPTASADSSNETFGFLAGSGFLCGLAPTACPDVSRADNGDTIQIAGSGALTTNPKTASGSGTFAHKRGNTTVASGTWTATDLLSFQDYGTSSDPSIPRVAHAGTALIAVHLVVTGGPATGLRFFDASGAQVEDAVVCQMAAAFCSRAPWCPAPRPKACGWWSMTSSTSTGEVSGFTVFIKP